MTDTKYLDEASRLAGYADWENIPKGATTLVKHIHAHAATLEELDKFRREVSETVQHLPNRPFVLDRFILPAPDPLGEAVGDALEGQGMGRPSHTTTEITARLRAAIEARGGKIVWEAGE